MQIGEFAAVCKTKISVLRHYDAQGVLVPDYVDRFTGYRYYSADQINDFMRITALKEAGFSLAQIKDMIFRESDREKLEAAFEKKKQEYLCKLQSLSSARKGIFGKEDFVNFVFDSDHVIARSSPVTPATFEVMCDEMEKQLGIMEYQRVSPYTLESTEEGKLVCECACVRLSDKVEEICESWSGEFVDDPSVVGKWQTVGEFACEEDFFCGKQVKGAVLYKKLRTVYFLPEGEEYWCYRWSAGKLIITHNDRDCTVNTYKTVICEGQTYMFVSLKSYAYRRGGKESVLVLRQLDNRNYTKEEITKKDNIDMPFENDNAVIGKWSACGFVYHISDFDPSEECNLLLAWKSLEFKENGEAVSVFYNGNTVSDRRAQEWTRGYFLRKWTSSACAYVIRVIEGKEYLFVEWKSGDYIYGGMDTNYYVFERE